MSITIDSTSKFLIVNGKKTFGCPSVGLLADSTSGGAGTVMKSDAYLQANKDFTFSILAGSSANYISTVIPMANKINMPWTKEGWNINSPDNVLMGSFFYDPLRMGYYQFDEPTEGIEISGMTTEATCLAAPTSLGQSRIWKNNACYYPDLRQPITNKYLEMQRNDPGKIMIIGIYQHPLTWSPMCDLITWGQYTYKIASWVNWSRAQSLYAWEVACNAVIYKNTDLSKIKTIMPLLQTIAIDMVEASTTFFGLTSQELRSQAYAGICQNTHGIIFGHAFSWAKGLDFSPSLMSTAQKIAAEIKLLNDYLVSNTQAFFWYGFKLNQSAVTFSNSKTETAGGGTVNNFSWILKQGLLIVVNKDVNPITTTIIIPSLMTSTITTTGLEMNGSGRAGRLINVNTNKSFSETFDGLGVHIYKLDNQSNCPQLQCRITLT